MFSPNLATVNYFHTDAIFMAACCVHDYWVDITSYVISDKKGQFLSQVWQQIEVQGSEGDGAQELGDQGWKYLEATDPVNLGIWVNSGNCQLFRFHNTENKATTLDDSKSWTTIQKLGSSKISPYTRCSYSFQKKDHDLQNFISVWRTCNILRALRTSWPRQGPTMSTLSAPMTSHGAWFPSLC